MSLVSFSLSVSKAFFYPKISARMCWNVAAKKQKISLLSSHSCFLVLCEFRDRENSCLESLLFSRERTLSPSLKSCLPPREWWCARMLRRPTGRRTTRTRHTIFTRKGFLRVRGSGGNADVACLSLRCPSRSKEETRNHVRLIYCFLSFSLSRVLEYS